MLQILRRCSRRAPGHGCSRNVDQRTSPEQLAKAGFLDKPEHLCVRHHGMGAGDRRPMPDECWRDRPPWRQVCSATQATTVDRRVSRSSAGALILCPVISAPGRVSGLARTACPLSSDELGCFRRTLCYGMPGFPRADAGEGRNLRQGTRSARRGAHFQASGDIPALLGVAPWLNNPTFRAIIR